MDTYVRFLYEFLNAFFTGLKTIFWGFVNGIKQIFDIPAYIHLIKEYRNDFSVQEWILVSIAILAVALILILTVFLVALLLRKYIRFRKTLVEQESMLKEVADLNNAKKALETSFPGIVFELDEISYFAKDTVTLEGEDKVKFERLLDMLDELDDVSNVYHNVEM